MEEDIQACEDEIAELADDIEQQEANIEEAARQSGDLHKWIDTELLL